MACERDVPFDCDRTRRLSDSTVLAVILHRRRRYALYYLREQSGPVSLDELVRQVAAWERRATCTTCDDEVTPTERESVRSSLRQTHLPYLAERGIVTYDHQRGRVAYDTDDSTLALYLANDPRTTVRWYRVYLVLTVISAVFLGLVSMGVEPFATLPPAGVAALVVGSFAAVSVAHWYDVYRWRRDTEDDPPNFLVTLGEEIVERDRGKANDSDDRDDRN